MLQCANWDNQTYVSFVTRWDSTLLQTYDQNSVSLSSYTGRQGRIWLPDALQNYYMYFTESETCPLVSFWHIFKVFKLIPTSSLSLGKYFKVGKLWIFTVSTSLAVESILAITTSSRSLNFSPSSSQIGASFLQWPHHGASAEKERKYSKNWPVLLF